MIYLTVIKYLAPVVLVFGALYAAYDYGYQKSEDEWVAKWSNYQREIVDHQLEHEKKLRSLESKWSQEFNKVSQDAQIQSNRLATDLAAAESQFDGLHKQFAKATAKLKQCGNPSATGASTITAEAGNMPAYVLARLDERAGKLAEYADRLESSLQACNGAYAVIYGYR